MTGEIVKWVLAIFFIGCGIKLAWDFLGYWFDWLEKRSKQ